jgi:hypothetical protein
MVKKGIVLTPHADYCLPGITRATVSIIKFHMTWDQSIQLPVFNLEQHTKTSFFVFFSVIFGTPMLFPRLKWFHNIKILLNVDATRYYRNIYVSETAGMVLSAFFLFLDLSAFIFDSGF